MKNRDDVDGLAGLSEDYEVREAAKQRLACLMRRVRKLPGIFCDPLHRRPYGVPEAWDNVRCVIFVPGDGVQ